MATKKKKKSIFSKIKLHPKHKKRVKGVYTFVKTDPVVRNSLIVLALFAVFTNLSLLRLGPITLSQEKYITVTGEYSSVEKNQIANFIITATSENIDKEVAVAQVTKSGIDLASLLRSFGVDPIDIKTTSNSVYQMDAPQATNVRNVVAPKLWQASTSIEVDLRDLDRVEELVSVLNAQGSLELYGPTYYLDETKIDEARMLVEAVKLAEEKAKFIAKNNNKEIGKILSIEELGNAEIFSYGSILGSTTDENTFPSFTAGSTQINKTVKVSFELD